MDLAFVLNEFLRDILYAIRLLSKRRTENMDKVIIYHKEYRIRL